jgi:hypothetical protein
MLSDLRDFIKKVRILHPSSDCVCLQTQFVTPINQTFKSYLRIFLSNMDCQLFLFDYHATMIIKGNFKRIETFENFSRVIESMINQGGKFSWILVNDPDYRYETLWGGSDPTINGSEYLHRDSLMLFPNDSDAQSIKTFQSN